MTATPTTYITNTITNTISQNFAFCFKIQIHAKKFNLTFVRCQSTLVHETNFSANSQTSPGNLSKQNHPQAIIPKRTKKGTYLDVEKY